MSFLGAPSREDGAERCALSPLRGQGTIISAARAALPRTFSIASAMTAAPVARPLLLRSVSAHERNRFRTSETVLVVARRLGGFPPRTARGARHHGVRPRRRRRRGAARHIGPRELRDEPADLFWHRATRRIGNLAGDDDVGGRRLAGAARRGDRRADVPDERVDAAVVRAVAEMAGLSGPLLPHRR